MAQLQVFKYVRCEAMESLDKNTILFSEFTFD